MPLQVASAVMTGKASATKMDAPKFCFGEGTQVMTASGLEEIQALEPGRRVLAKQGAGHVVDTFQTWNADVRELWMEGLETPVRVTGGHRFYSETRGGWVEAHRLLVGETVRTLKGSGRRRPG